MSADFLDSNIFVYMADRTSSNHQRSREVVAGALTERSIISFQVVQEVLNVLIRRFAWPVDVADIRVMLRDVLEPLWQVMPSPALYERTLDIQSRYRYAFFDSLIIASALSAGCTRLLTEDMQHGQQIDGLRIENPFRSA